MRRPNPDLIDALAARYVVGTMGRLARRRFEAYCASSPLARRAVLDWQQQLQPLAREVQAIRPPRRVWRKIQRRLGPAPTHSRNLPWLWPLASATLAAVALALGVLLWQGQPKVDYVAAVTSEEGQVAWSVSIDANDRLVVNAAAVPTLPATQTHELWVLPANGSNPVSLGLIPQLGEQRIILSERQQNALLGATTLAVSIEPAGGSPTGVPTGPVVFTATLTATAS